MRNRLILGTLCAALLTAAFSSVANASSIDIGPISMTNVTDINGALTGSTSGSIFNISGAPVNNFSVFNGSFSFAANFDTTTNAFLSGNFSLGGTLLDSAMNPVEAASVQGTLTSLSQTNTTLIFTFDTTTTDPALSSFGPAGVLQVKIPSAPSGFQLGGTFAATGISTADITAVPTPDALSAGLLLLGGIAIYGARRTLKLS